ncbi:neutral amino acid transporter 9-like isoform X2 [Neocloeon triangulifer]|uniref:neutral amino acid transporter 9-like isoform X2 n=1 Tax=Neocloeon triangulifer TaxID=2078957 RepID=UPI00286FAA83|nr:neutral amino acid transporter 9-like isoform X2 [Neocloeon triangulifer]
MSERPRLPRRHPSRYPPNNFEDQTTDSGGESQPLLSSDTSRTSNNSYTRRPFHYQTQRRISGQIDESSSATYNRFQYYNKLRSTVTEEEPALIIPDHVIPPTFFLPYIPGADRPSGKQSSIVTIFAIWNTIMGSSLLSMPWGVSQAGLGGGLILMLFMSTICLYTTWRLLKINQLHGGEHTEVPDLSKKLIGWPAEIAAKIFSLVVLLGATIVYWVLMSNFLYYSVDYFYTKFTGELNVTANSSTILCPKVPLPPNNDSSSLFSFLQASPEDSYHKWWNMYTTVPLVLIPFIGPLICCRDATFFTKFNSVGTLSVFYLLIFIGIKGFQWGINADIHDSNSPSFTPIFESSFPALSGLLALSFFIHNIVITVMKNNQNQENNGRDLSIAYVLVTMTYIIIGFVFYVTFPLAKSCIEDNILNNFPGWDLMAVTARIFLLFQLVTVFPLVAYMIRVQVFAALKLPATSLQARGPIFALNTLIICLCVVFAIFLPKIGTIARFTGAISGMVYVFTLPCLLHMISLYWENRLTCFQVLIHTIIPLIGGINLLAQFFVL